MNSASEPDAHRTDALSISVVIPTFNGERYLRQQLQSIQAQSRQPDEIVIYDDGSQDGTVAVIESFVWGAPIRVRLLRGEHVGLRRNVQRALEASTGEVIVLADQDDLWESKKLEVIASAFFDPTVTLWFSDARLVGADGTLLGQSLWQGVAMDEATRAAIESGQGLKRLIHGQTVTGATMAIRRSVLDIGLPLPVQLEMPEHLMLHDGWLAVLGSVLGSTVADPRALTHYRQHDSQVTGMSMTRGLAADAARSREHAERDVQLRNERDRVRLVLDRLRERDVLGKCRGADVEWLQSIEAFYAVRSAPVGLMRFRGIARQVHAGGYRRFARGWRTALRDAFSVPPN